MTHFTKTPESLLKRIRGTIQNVDEQHRVVDYVLFTGRSLA
jgi:hypothetical protein